MTVTMNPDTKRISQKERSALRSAVRLQMKVLRAEVNAREAELLAEVESELSRRFTEDRLSAERLRGVLRELTRECNERLAALRKEYAELFEAGRWQVSEFSTPFLSRRQDDREQLRRALLQQARLKTRLALRRLDQQEADLLMNLAMDALETDEARAFLGQIPTLNELIPGTVQELEGALE